MLHRPWILAAALFVPATVLSACGGGEETSTEGATETTTTLPTTTSPTTDPTTAGPTSDSETTDTTGPTGSESDSDSDPSETTDTSTDTDPTTSDSDSTDSDSTDSDTSDSDTDPTTGDPPCTEGEIVCVDNEAQECVDGELTPGEVCEEACADGIGCVFCAPGSSTCEGDQIMVCNDEGDAYEPGETCDGLQGLECDPDQGVCVGACANLGLSYIGCDYYPTVTLQHDSYNGGGHQYAVAVANTTNANATITVSKGDVNITEATVAAGSVQTLTLPWVDALTKGHGPSKVVVDGAYRLRSTQPVTVYQYNPISATTTNDASLLLPANTWTGRYLVAAWPQWGSYPGWYAVVAREDGTTVTLSPSATGGNVQPGGGVAANGTGMVTLDASDVLVVPSSAGDVTGTIVDADKPVQVFGGHECTNVPLNVSACDHLEEAMFPIETLASEYIVVPPVQVPNNNLDKAQIVRVIASEPDTNVTFDPDQGADTTLVNAGDYVELSSTQAAFLVSADKKILVSQYMVGQSAGFGTSDPAMLVAVATEQYRTNYLVHAPTSWQANFVDIIGPDGANVEVDGQAVVDWTPIGNTGYSVAHEPLSNGGDGTHSITSDLKVGISVYGVQSFGSYWYPGGLDLTKIE